MASRNQNPSAVQFAFSDGKVFRDGTPLKLPDLFVMQKLGEGANGVVFEARDLALDRLVAVKFWNRRVADPQSRAIAEIRKIAGLRHPLLVTVHRFEVTEEWPFAVMELVRGTCLREFLRNSTLTLKDRCGLWGFYSKALHFIYSRGMVHGDPHVGNAIVFGDSDGVFKGFIDSSIHTRKRFGLKVADTGTSRIWTSMAKFRQRETRLLLETANRIFIDPSPSELLSITKKADPRVALAVCDQFAEFVNSYSDLPATHFEHGFDIMDELVQAMVGAPFFLLSRVFKQLENVMHPNNVSDIIRDLGSRIGVRPRDGIAAVGGRPTGPIADDELQLIEKLYSARRPDFIRACLEGSPHLDGLADETNL